MPNQKFARNHRFNCGRKLPHIGPLALKLTQSLTQFSLA